MFVCVDALHPSQQFFSHVGTFFCLDHLHNSGSTQEDRNFFDFDINIITHTMYSHTLCGQVAKALIRLSICAGLSESTLIANVTFQNL